MGETSKISWTDSSWNPVIGCSHVSDGCTRCYAETLALRWGWKGNDGQPMTAWTNRAAAHNVVLKPHRLREPLKWKEPRRVFVNSLSDAFHPLIPTEYLDAMFAVMAQCPQHTFQVLTKRPERAAAYARYRADTMAVAWPAHVWLGVTVEDRKALPRIDILRSIHDVPVRFLSCEPLLEPLGRLDLSGIAWVIVGGESGRGYRTMPHAWAREIRDACVEQQVSYFFKQSSGPRSEMNPTLLEEDGTRTEWHQWPADNPAAVMA